MKKLILVLILLALILSPAVTQAKKDKAAPLGSRGNGVLCTDHFPARSARSAAALEKLTEELSYPPYPYEDTFTLHSNPGNSHRLYIDVDGHTEYGENYTAWDPDGDGDSFSENERLLIQKMWFLVSEDFMPFNVDVTTEDPGEGFLGMRAVVDGSELWDYGWAYVGTWGDGDNNIAYTGLWGNDWLWIAQAASHEVGHTLGLLDHGDDTTGYYMGHGEGATAWGVIMGWDSFGLGVWDDGDYPNANNPEDSLAIISARPGAGYRPDDHASTHGASATEIIFSGGPLQLVAEGVIEQRTDVDYFRFTTLTSGDVQFSINEDVIIGIAQTNLDVLAKIHDSGGAVLYESNPLWDIWASFDVTLAAGTYYLSIDGTGQDHPDGDPDEGYGYSDYGILGYYSIYASGAASGDPDVTPPTPDPMTWATVPYATSDSSIAMDATVATDAENGVEYYFTCLEDDDHDSGWQAGTSYEDTGLVPETQYTYTVTARDTSGNFNETAPSTAESATTDVDTVAPTPDQMTWETVPAPGGGFQVVDSSGFEVPDQGDSGWAYRPTGSVWTFTGGSGLSGPNGPWKCDSTSPDPAGDQFAFLQDVATISKDLTGLAIGQTYELSFFESYRTGYGSSNDLSVILDEGLPAEATIYSNSNVTNATWEARTTSQFVAAKTSYTLTFSTTNPLGGDRSTIIDGAEVTTFIDSETTIVMTATTATDPSGVEYYFTCTAGPGNDSGWQDDTEYTDTGLDPGTQYTYTVTARDKSAAQNETAPSTAESAITAGESPGDPVPDVVGMTQAAAEAAIVAAGFTVGTVTTDYSPTVPVGDVISQNPAGGTGAPAGSPVDLVVSLGPPPPVDVPDVVGMSQAAAQAAIIAASLTVGNVTTDYSPTVPAGVVISQNPIGGASVPAGSPVDIVVSLGPEVIVPDVVGLSQAAAEAAIVAAGLTVGTVTQEYNPSVPVGDVISQNPSSGTSVVEGTPVDLVISLDVPPDVVTIIKAEYKADKDEFKVEATSSEGSSVTLTLVGFGEMTFDKDKFKFSAKPLGVLPPCTAVVNSTGGGSDSKAVSGADPCDPGGDPVPDVVGMTQAAAEAAIVAAGMTVGTVTTDYSPTVPAGDVISQDPAGGTSAPAGSSVDLVVSLGPPPPVTVPDVVGMSQAAAEAAIVAASLTVGNVTTDYSATVPAGDVISQDPAGGASVAAGTAVDIVVSLGAEVIVPDVVGLAQAAAEAAIVAANLTVGNVTTEYHASVPVGDVISQNPSSGTSVVEGSAVDLVVSDGPGPSGDTVIIIKAEYKADKSELKVEATTSEGSNVTLTVVGYGDMTYDKDLKHKYSVKDVADPGATVTVTSSGGGQDTASVTHK